MLQILSFAVLSVFAQSTYAVDTVDNIRLRDVSLLVLQPGMYTTARRSNPVPQLNCLSGEYCHSVMSSPVTCSNVGWDGDVVWSCVGDMPDHLKFGTLTMTCEGFLHPEDECNNNNNIVFDYLII